MKGVNGTLVSACLMGRFARPDGIAPADPDMIVAEHGSHLLAVCPVVEGGLCAPLEGACLDGGAGAAVLKGRARVRSATGEDVTDPIVLGVVKILSLVRAHRIDTAVLKAGNAMCGVGSAPDAAGIAIGDGVLAAGLRCQGVAVCEVPD